LPQRWHWRLLAAQDQPPPKPTFKSAVDLVPVDVNVIDKSGRPVPDQAAGDFTLTVDGKPRRAVNGSNRPRRSLQGAFIPRGGRAGTDFSGRMSPETRARLGTVARQVLALPD
jgi:hypothetical protein